jgi:Ca2+-binding RTX toxin-like protein
MSNGNGSLEIGSTLQLGATNTQYPDQRFRRRGLEGNPFAANASGDRIRFNGDNKLDPGDKIIEFRSGINEPGDWVRVITGNSTSATEADFEVNKYLENALDGQSIPFIEGLGPVLIPDIEAGSDGDFKTEGVFHIEIDDLANSQTMGGRFRDVVDSALEVKQVFINGVDKTAAALDASTNTIDYSFGPLGNQKLKVDVHYEFLAENTKTLDISLLTGLSDDTNDYSSIELLYQAYLLPQIDEVSGNTYRLNGTRSNTVQVFANDGDDNPEDEDTASIGIVSGLVTGKLANNVDTTINIIEQEFVRGTLKTFASKGWWVNNSDLGTNGLLESLQLSFADNLPQFSPNEEATRQILANLNLNQFEEGELQLDNQVETASIPIIAGASGDLNEIGLFTEGKDEVDLNNVDPANYEFNALGGDDFVTLPQNGLSQIFSGGSGNDLITGLDGNDTISGDGGDDDLIGNRGNDILIGGDGDDFLEGGDGIDTFRFDDRDNNNNGGETPTDTIADFEFGIDIATFRFDGGFFGDSGITTINNNQAAFSTNEEFIQFLAQVEAKDGTVTAQNGGVLAEVMNPANNRTLNYFFSGAELPA